MQLAQAGITAAMAGGRTIERFDEHPAWIDKRVPGEFTLAARRLCARGGARPGGGRA
ncbi:MAG: hypothetical protein ACI4P5_10080 [Candidatus Fimadaptatus sp.]